MYSYSGSVEKKPLLCYPFEYHAPPFIQKDPSYCGRNIVTPGAGYFAVPNIFGLPLAIFSYPGKGRDRSSIFCVFDGLVHFHYQPTVCKKAVGMACKWGFAPDTGPDRNGDLSIIGRLHFRRTRGRTPLKQSCHNPDNVWHLYPYNPFGNASSPIC